MKKLLVLIMAIVLCVGICGCENDEKKDQQIEWESLRFDFEKIEKILERASDKPYDELIKESYSTGQCLYNYFHYFPGILPLEQTQKLWDELYNDITVTDTRLHIECLRKTDNAIYSIHRIDEDYLLFIEYNKYYIDDKRSFTANLETMMILPTTVTLSDDDVSSIKVGKSKLLDVESIDVTTKKGFSISAQLDKSSRSKAVKEAMDGDFEEFCAIPLFSTIHYTVEGNWYKISYGLRSDGRFSDASSWERTEIRPGTASAAADGIVHVSSVSYKVLSVEQIDAPPILEQDLPK